MRKVLPSLTRLLVGHHYKAPGVNLLLYNGFSDILAQQKSPFGFMGENYSILSTCNFFVVEERELWHVVVCYKVMTSGLELGWLIFQNSSFSTKKIEDSPSIPTWTSYIRSGELSWIREINKSTTLPPPPPPHNRK